MRPWRVSAWELKHGFKYRVHIPTTPPALNSLTAQEIRRLLDPLSVRRPRMVSQKLREAEQGHTGIHE